MALASCNTDPRAASVRGTGSSWSCRSIGTSIRSYVRVEGGDIAKGVKIAGSDSRPIGFAIFVETPFAPSSAVVFSRSSRADRKSRDAHSDTFWERAEPREDGREEKHVPGIFIYCGRNVYSVDRCARERIQSIECRLDRFSWEWKWLQRKIVEMLEIVECRGGCLGIVLDSLELFISYGFSFLA